jgi:membrane protein
LTIEETRSPGAQPSATARKRRTFYEIALNIWRAIAADNISLLAAGVAFYMLLAIFPGLTFIVAMFGLLAEPAQVRQELLSLKDILPAEAWDAIDAQLLSLTRQNTTTLSLASLVSLLLAFVNARLGAYAMMGALNVVYGRKETRSFVRINIIAFMFTLSIAN